jgi:hypothetical protein
MKTEIRPDYLAILRELKIIGRYRQSRSTRYNMKLLNTLTRFSVFIRLSVKPPKAEAEYWSTIAAKGDAIQHRNNLPVHHSSQIIQFR